MQHNEPTNTTQQNEQLAMHQIGLKPNFLLIDDDPINNLLCSSIIERVLPQAEIVKFTEPEKGLDYIKGLANNTPSAKTILYLDINMPGMNGWEFMEAFETLDKNTREQIVIYILSSSIDPRDIEKAKNNSYIVDYFVKPLKKENILSSQNYLQQLRAG